MSEAMIINNRIVYRGFAAPITIQMNRRFYCECEVEKKTICCDARTLDGLIDQFVECVDNMFEGGYEEAYERAYANLRAQAPAEDYDPADDLPFV